MPRAPFHKSQGLTLIELLFTMVILSIVLGLGVGALTGLKAPTQQNTGLVRSVLRAAANQAISHEAGCAVTFDQAAGAMYPSELRVVGTWHFEDTNLNGAFGLNGSGPGVRIVDDGYIGKAISLQASGVEANFAVKRDPAFDLTEGFVVELALRDPIGKGGRVLHIGHMVGIDLEAGGVVRGWIAPDFSGGKQQAETTESQAARATHLFVESRPGTVLPGAWIRVRLEYDRTMLTLSVDGTKVDELESDAPVRELVGDLGLSSKERDGFRGDVDKLVVSAISAMEPVMLGDDAAFTKETPKRVVFHGGGGLDPTVHDRPLEIGIEFIDGQRGTVKVGILGTVE
ncbi:MAG: prepilin-type N-terminal cleavage/methylation domain-containing protein [Bacteroidia bacterium]|jgi:prepilin-type N-terminal cleavage/methylation domain-containing protein